MNINRYMVQDASEHCSALADDLGQCSRVNALYAGNVLFAHPLRQGPGAAPMARRVAVFGDDQCRGPYPARLEKTEKMRVGFIACSKEVRFLKVIGCV